MHSTRRPRLLKQYQPEIYLQHALAAFLHDAIRHGRSVNATYDYVKKITLKVLQCVHYRHGNDADAMMLGGGNKVAELTFALKTMSSNTTAILVVPRCSGGVGYGLVSLASVGYDPTVVARMMA